MSTLKVDNLLNSAGNESPISVPGAAKAWITFDGGTKLDSFNVAAVTNSSGGVYAITFTNNLGNANYTILGCVANTTTDFASTTAGSIRGACGVQVKGDVAPTTSGFTIETLYGSSGSANGSLLDFSRGYVVVFGD